jgi:hypothetical protein
MRGNTTHGANRYAVIKTNVSFVTRSSGKDLYVRNDNSLRLVLPLGDSAKQIADSKLARNRHDKKITLAGRSKYPPPMT